MIVKECKVHGPLKAEETRYKNENNIRCKHCERDSAKKSRTKNGAKYNEQRRVRRLVDHVWAEEQRKKDREGRRKNYYKNREKILKARSDKNKNNPEKLMATNLRKMYGITISDYEMMVEQQKNLCAICFQPETSIHPRTKEIKKLSVDHNHDTGKVRGLLCTRCNCMIGYARESEILLSKAIKYLRTYNASTE